MGGDMTNQPDIDLLFQYALARAARADDFHWRELGPIHLLKYAYLADLEHAARNGGATYTGIKWRFHHFGPWSVTAHDRIKPALLDAGAVERHFSSPYSNDHIRYRLEREEADRFEKALSEQLPYSVTRTISRAVHDHGPDTAGLLRHVYLTAPVLAARPGQILDFSSAVVPADPATSREDRPRVGPTAGEKRRRAKILKAGRERIRQRIAKRQASRVRIPSPTPRYDSVFVTGVEALNRQAGIAPTTKSGKLLFDDSVWSSSQRRDPEVP